MLGLMPESGEAFWVIARRPGFVAREERTRQRPYRDVGRQDVECDGPDPRPVS